MSLRLSGPKNDCWWPHETIANVCIAAWKGWCRPGMFARTQFRLQIVCLRGIDFPSGCNVVEEGFNFKDTGISLHLRITSFQLPCRLPSFSGRAISAPFVGARILRALSYFMIRARALHATGAALTSA